MARGARCMVPRCRLEASHVLASTLGPVPLCRGHALEIARALSDIQEGGIDRPPGMEPGAPAQGG